MSSLNNIDEDTAINLIRIQLTNLRKSKHISQKELAQLSGLSVSCISDIESDNNTSPTLKSLIRYITALGEEFYIRPITKTIQEENE